MRMKVQPLQDGRPRIFSAKDLWAAQVKKVGKHWFKRQVTQNFPWCKDRQVQPFSHWMAPWKQNTWCTSCRLRRFSAFLHYRLFLAPHHCNRWWHHSTATVGGNLDARNIIARKNHGSFWWTVLADHEDCDFENLKADEQEINSQLRGQKILENCSWLDKKTCSASSHVVEIKFL